MNLRRVFGPLHSIDSRADVDLEVSSVEYDSRRVTPGDLFVAMRGQSTNGNRYLEAALKRGASAIVTDSRIAYESLATTHPQVPAALVEHGRRALAEASAVILGHPERQLALTGVTGTNGKTTTAFILEALLRSASRTCVLLGTIEYHVGNEVRASAHTTPESRDILEVFADGVRAGATEAVMEMSSHALDQERIWGLPVDVAIFTNLTQDHLDYHGDMERYFAAKLKLFHGVGTVPPRVAVVNIDDPYGRRIATEAKHSKLITYGLDKAAMLHADHIRSSGGETVFRLWHDRQWEETITTLAGRVNMYNLLAASAAAFARGLTLEEIAVGVSNTPQVPGRFHVVPSLNDITVVIDYAHTDDALRNLIGLARETVTELRHRIQWPGSRVITLFGCGGDRDKSKRPKMGRAAGKGSDLVILTSDNPRTEDPAVIIAEALAGVEETGTTCIVEEDRRGAIEIAIRSAKPGDIVLLAGKGHEKVQILADGTIPFDDAAVAAEVLGSCRSGGVKVYVPPIA